MGKVIIKMRDKNNSHLIMPEKISLSGTQVVEVESTEKIKDGLKKGLFVEATEKELEAWKAKNVNPVKVTASVAPENVAENKTAETTTTEVTGGGAKVTETGAPELSEEEKAALAEKDAADQATKQATALLDQWKEEKKISFSPGGGYKFGDVVLGKNKVEAVAFLQTNVEVAEQIANFIPAE